MVQTITPAWSVGTPDDGEPTAFDRAVERWNWLLPDERQDAIATCRQEGHPPRLDVGFAHVCVRCLAYTDREGG